MIDLALDPVARALAYAPSDNFALWHERRHAKLCPICGVHVGEDGGLHTVSDSTPSKFSRAPALVYLGPCGHAVLRVRLTKAVF